MGLFVDDLIVKHIDGNLWQVFYPLEFHMGFKGSNRRIRVHVGFKTDLGSTPWLTRGFFPKSGPHNPAFVLHDFLYHNKGKVMLYGEDGQPLEEVIFSRKECDDIFMEGMLAVASVMPKENREQRVKKQIFIHKARIMYTAVRVFGQTAWDS